MIEHSTGLACAPVPLLRAGEERHVSDIAARLIGGAVPARRAILVAGIPAAGKSSLCTHLEQLGAVILNRDIIRQRLYGNAGELGDPRKTNAQFYSELKAQMATGKVVVSDNVNITRLHRAGAIACAKEAGYKVTIVAIDVELEVALARNRERERHVPEEAIRDMHASMQKDGWPKKDEGKLLILQNGCDFQHYKITHVRLWQRS